MSQIKLKERRFVKKYLETGNLGKAAEGVFNINPKYQSSYGSTVIRRPRVKAYLEELLDEYGLSDEKIARKIKKIVDAGTRRKPLRETSAQTALEALKFTAKLKDIVPSTKVEQKTATLNLDLSAKNDEELQEALNTLSQEIKSFQKKFLKKEKPEESKIGKVAVPTLQTNREPLTQSSAKPTN
jgi:hypothetical protein